MSVQITLVYNRSNPFGIRADAELLEAAIQAYNREKGITFAKVSHADILEPPSPTDICIHLEIPATTWMPWARRNLFMVNAEWYVPAWDCILPRFDEVLLKIKDQRDLSGTYVPWRASVAPSDFSKYPQRTTPKSCLWLLGGSKNKRDAAASVLPLWQPEWPPVDVYTTSALDLSGAVLGGGVTVHVQDLDQEERRRLQSLFPVHLCLSRSEGFGLAAAEAEAAGAFLILNDIAAYTSAFEGHQNVGWVKTLKTCDIKYTRAEFANFSESATAQLATIFAGFGILDIPLTRSEQTSRSHERMDTFTKAINTLLKSHVDAVRAMPAMGPLPPPLSLAECPPISVVTLTYNRRKFIDVAFHNLIMSDYPKDKIEWVIVDDSDDPNEAVADKINKFANRAPVAQVQYVPLPNRYTVGGKRNIGVQRASHDIILFMDDDDHYPETSFRRRVGWLTQHPWKPQVVACSTIACYDLVRGVSAVNTPPWELGPASRVSEATLTFYKSFWDTHRFPFTNTSEGEGFLAGNEHVLLDIPPQQILVAFSHQGNASGRRIPSGPDTKPGCFFGFPKEYLVWIHKLAGIEVEEEN